MRPKNRVAGYTLVELMVAIGIFAFAGLVITSIISNSTSQFTKMQSTLGLQQQSTTVEAALKKTLKQAVNIRYRNPIPAPVVISSGTEGYIRDYTSSHGGALTTLAIFAREAGVRANLSVVDPTNTSTTSFFKPTGIFFIPPSLTAPYTSGVLFIDLGANPASIQPDYGDLYIPGLVSMTIDSINTSSNVTPPPTYLPMMSARFTIVMREFPPSGDPQLIRSWCAPASCPSNIMPYKDTTHVFTILFRNNEIGTDPNSTVLKARPLGLLYFFDMKERN